MQSSGFLNRLRRAKPGEKFSIRQGTEELPINWRVAVARDILDVLKREGFIEGTDDPNTFLILKSMVSSTHIDIERWTDTLADHAEAANGVPTLSETQRLQFIENCLQESMQHSHDEHRVPLLTDSLGPLAANLYSIVKHYLPLHHTFGELPDPYPAMCEYLSTVLKLNPALSKVDEYKIARMADAWASAVMNKIVNDEKSNWRREEQ